VIAEIKVIPVGVGTSLSRHIGKACEIIKESGLKYQLTPTATVIEGDMDEILELMKRIHNTLMNELDRCIFMLTIDSRKDKVQSLEERIESIRR